MQGPCEMCLEAGIFADPCYISTSDLVCLQVLRSLGLNPTMLACRCSEPLEDAVREKLVGAGKYGAVWVRGPGQEGGGEVMPCIPTSGRVSLPHACFKSSSPPSGPVLSPFLPPRRPSSATCPASTC